MMACVKVVLSKITSTLSGASFADLNQPPVLGRMIFSLQVACTCVSCIGCTIPWAPEMSSGIGKVSNTPTIEEI